MRKELTFTELDREPVALLPERETLLFNNNWAGIVATNSSLALNAASLFAGANSTAAQHITVVQYG
jgi:hypothetical protein